MNFTPTPESAATMSHWHQVCAHGLPRYEGCYACQQGGSALADHLRLTARPAPRPRPRTLRTGTGPRVIPVCGTCGLTHPGEC